MTDVEREPFDSSSTYEVTISTHGTAMKFTNSPLHMTQSVTLNPGDQLKPLGTVKELKFTGLHDPNLVLFHPEDNSRKRLLLPDGYCVAVAPADLGNLKRVDR